MSLCVSPSLLATKVQRHSDVALLRQTIMALADQSVLYHLATCCSSLLSPGVTKI